MSAHTKGPWVIRCGPPLFRPGSVNVLSAAGDYVCEVGDVIAENADADASLIAAAPDLLEALKEAVCALECSGKDWHATTIARAAIAKATPLAAGKGAGGDV